MKQLTHLDIANQLAETPASLEQLLKLVDNDLAQHKVNARLRRSRGKDIDAACGQLANKDH